jgi:branched-chain amino acid transport system substrate-binding protein
MLEKGGITTVYNNFYESEAQDSVTAAANAIAAKKPDIVVLGTENPDFATAYIKVFKQQHYSPKAIIELAGPDQGQSFLNAIGGSKAAEGVFVPNGGWWPQSTAYQNADFVKGFMAANKITDPNNISSDSTQAFAAGQVLQEAAAKAKSIDNKALLAVLQDTTNTWNTVLGPVQFNKAGENVAAVAYLFQWQGGNLIPVYPAGQAQNNPEYPKPTW